MDAVAKRDSFIKLYNEIGAETFLGILSKEYSLKLYQISTSWLHDPKYILKAKGSDGDLIIEWGTKNYFVDKYENKIMQMDLEEFKVFALENKENIDIDYQCDEAIEEMSNWKYKGWFNAIQVWNDPVNNKFQFNW